jgi:hypothetical protein
MIDHQRELESTLPPTPLEVAKGAELRAFKEYSRNPNTETWRVWYRTLEELHKQRKAAK